MTTPDPDKAPDDLSGLEQPAHVRFIGGDPTPADLAHYDQALQRMNLIASRLFFIHVTVRDIDIDAPGARDQLSDLAQEASELVWTLDEQEKALLISILVGQVVNAANDAITAGWLPTDDQLDSPMYRDQVSASTGIPPAALDQIVARIKARRASHEGGQHPQPPAAGPARAGA